MDKVSGAMDAEMSQRQVVASPSAMTSPGM